uniref:Uncharacterized protein n=1 Tax=Anguilla anguilla TaxID=7936 RepID=A0A0E9P7N8_ANGAN
MSSVFKKCVQIVCQISVWQKKWKFLACNPVHSPVLLAYSSCFGWEAELNETREMGGKAVRMYSMHLNSSSS